MMPVRWTVNLRHTAITRSTRFNETTKLTTSTSCRNSSINHELDEKLATLHFPALGEVLTVLAREHADYTGVKVEGPFKGEHQRY